MRDAALLSLIALLASCGGGGPAPLPTGRVSAYFRPGGVADTIDIDALDRLPLRSAGLVAPDGRMTAAGPIVARPAPSSGSVLALPAGTYRGGASALGSIGAISQSVGPVGAAVQSESTLLATLSTTTIVLPDPTAYRRDWRRDRIRLTFGDPPAVDRREIAAPAPPAAGEPAAQ